MHRWAIVLCVLLGVGCLLQRAGSRSGVGELDGGFDSGVDGDGAPPSDGDGDLDADGDVDGDGESSVDGDLLVDAEVLVDGDPEGCDPASPAYCEGAVLVSCVGGAIVELPCALGCGGTPARCAELSPSNVGEGVAEGTAETSTDEVTGLSRWVLDTDSGSITASDDSGREVVVRPVGEGVIDGIGFTLVDGSEEAAPDLGVFSFGSLVVVEGSALVGQGGRALVLLVARDASIAGRLSVAAVDERPGPGGSAGGGRDGGTGGGPGGGHGGSDDSSGDGGGGGGSFGSSGGRGGKPCCGGEPGPTYGAAELAPLVGGSGGGGGKDPDGGRGGGGGGALQLTAGGSIVVTSTGVVDAGGGGGEGGRTNDGAGGGGSGGAILLEAPVVEVLGHVGANGGGGGQGDTCDDCGGLRGAPGDPLVLPAPGSPTEGIGGGGGAGSDEVGAAGDGLDGTNGGGGGGGAGRVRLNTASGAEPYESGVTPTVASGLSTVGAVGRAF